MPYESTITLAEIAARLAAAQHVALVTHERPDGDALGSLLAIKRTLDARDVLAEIFIMGHLETPLHDVAGATPYRRVEHDPPGDDYDVIVVADTGAWSQLAPLEEWLRRHRERVIVIDHHARGDDIGAGLYVDPSAAATAQVVVDLLDEMAAPLTGGKGGVAEALFVGLATDTGWFRYDNAGAREFAVATRLLEQGVDKSRLFQSIEETHPPERLALEARALESIEFIGDVAVVSLTQEDFVATGCTSEHLTGIVNLPMVVGDVRVAILLAEVKPTRVKMSFRSKPPRDGETFVDVNQLAHRFGGGGHPFAAGARYPADLETVRPMLLAALADESVISLRSG